MTTQIPTSSHNRLPLREAIFEMACDNVAGKMITPARIDEQLPEFTHHREMLVDFAVEFQMKDGGLNPVPQHRPRVRQWDASKQRAVQFGPGMCAYNVLGAAYSRFEDQPLSIKRVARFYFEEIQPTKIVELGQRYINAVSIPLAETDIQRFFPLYPVMPETMRGHRPMVMQLQTAEKKTGDVTVTLSLEKRDETEATYLLDIHARSKGEIPLDADAVATWHSSIHQAVRDTFRLSVSELLRMEPSA